MSKAPQRDEQVVALEGEIRELFETLARDHTESVRHYSKLAETSYSRDLDGFKLGIAIGDSVADGTTRSVVAVIGRYDRSTLAAAVISSIIDGVRQSALFEFDPWVRRQYLDATPGEAVCTVLSTVGLEEVVTAIHTL